MAATGRGYRTTARADRGRPKIEVSLSREAIARLDEMRERHPLGTRSAVVEELVMASAASGHR